MKWSMQVHFYKVGFILAFSGTGKSWKINAGPGKSLKVLEIY